MIAQWTIAGSIAVTGAAQVVLPLVAPINDAGTRITIALVYLAAGIAGLLVCRWDNRAREREMRAVASRHPSAYLRPDRTLE